MANKKTIKKPPSWGAAGKHNSKNQLQEEENPKESWRNNEAVIELTSNHLMLSEEMCNILKANSSSELAMFSVENTVYISNTSGQSDVPRSTFKISEPVQGKYLNARRCISGSYIRSLSNPHKHGLATGHYIVTGILPSDYPVLSLEAYELEVPNTEIETKNLQNVDHIFSFKETISQKPSYNPNETSIQPADVVSYRYHTPVSIPPPDQPQAQYQVPGTLEFLESVEAPLQKYQISPEDISNLLDSE